MAKEESGDQASKPVDAPTARRRQDAIGRRLRQMYEDVVREDVPTDFLQFLQEADERGAGHGQSPKPNGGKSSGK
jgi:hypothetical protein